MPRRAVRNRYRFFIPPVGMLDEAISPIRVKQAGKSPITFLPTLK